MQTLVILGEETLVILEERTQRSISTSTALRSDSDCTHLTQ
jgi:hypothetical protein